MFLFIKLNNEIILTRRIIISLFLLGIITGPFNLVQAQPAPTEEENIPFLVTFGNEANTSYGDDDFSQTFYFSIPESQKTPFYIRIFDPDIGGKTDELTGDFNTKTRFEIFGGKDVVPKEDEAKYNPVGTYKNGILLASKIFGSSVEYDDKWYTFGPFNPAEGGLHPELGGYIFKIISEGIEGDDGNLYKYYLSKKPNENITLEGGNSFTYEYSLRLHDTKGAISHIYPFIDENVVAIKIHNFDFDNDGFIRVISTSKRGLKINHSGDDDWAQTLISIRESEKKSSLDIQMVKLTDSKNNNVVFYITNQYDETMPFYTSPIGGVPKYSYKIGIEYKK